jgi:hypothetical protein
LFGGSKGASKMSILLRQLQHFWNHFFSFSIENAFFNEKLSMEAISVISHCITLLHSCMPFGIGYIFLLTINFMIICLRHWHVSSVNTLFESSYFHYCVANKKIIHNICCESDEALDVVRVLWRRAQMKASGNTCGCCFCCLHFNEMNEYEEQGDVKYIFT